MQPLPHTPLESSVGCLGTGGGGRRQDLLQKIQFGVWVDGRLLHEGARASGGFDDSSTTDAGNTLPRFIMTMGSICELLPSHMAADPIGMSREEAQKAISPRSFEPPVCCRHEDFGSSIQGGRPRSQQAKSVRMILSPRLCSAGSQNFLA